MYKNDNGNHRLKNVTDNEYGITKHISKNFENNIRYNPANRVIKQIQ